MSNSETGAGRRGFPWRPVLWSLPVLILALPLVLGAPWTLSDYVIMGGLLAGAGLVLELLARASGNLAYRAGSALAVLAAFLLVWVNGAVGFLGDEGNPANLMFFGVIAVAVIGAAAGGFRAAGMALAMFAAAAAQLLVGVMALGMGWASPGEAGLYEVVLGTTAFGGLWLVAGGLFRRAAGGPAT